MPKTVRRIDGAAQSLVVRRKRVAAYARVSVSTDSLLRSLDAQVSYFSKLIQSTPGWEYAGVFVDRGISGTQAEGRDEFNRMLAECEAGNIDIILVKSLSRFARNTVDTLQTVRRLKALGVEVRFEKENINTMDETGELMITLYATFAQEESRSISENSKWGIRKRIANGTIGMANKHILGYRYDEEKKQYVIIPEEAVIVRQIFSLFLEGKTLQQICDVLNGQGTRTIKNCFFQESTMAMTLKNEIYVGDLRRQKTYIEDPLTKKKVRNKGKVQQFIYTDCHEGILDRETWNRVQAEYEKRRARMPKPRIFSKKITCGVCGKPFTVRTISGKRGKYDYWFCRAKKNPGSTCYTDNFRDDVLRSVCAEALGMEAFDEAAFEANIKHITVDISGDIDIELVGGGVYHWKNYHLHESHVPNTSTNAFHGKIRCSICGDRFYRQHRTGRWVYWYCMGKRKNLHCTNGIYTDYLFRQVSAMLMGTDEFDEEAFLEQVDFIEAAADQTLIYHFKDGRTAQWQKR